jgi:uncharacterized membrane protein HdeD (DUF308 family)
MTTPRGSRVARWLPETIAVNPERTLINAACVLMGLSALVQRSPVWDHLWPFAQYEWGAAMFGGGLAALIGMFGQRRTTDRLGLLLITAASLVWALVLFVEYGPRAVLTSLIFLALAGAKVIRLIVTSAVRTKNIQLGELMREGQADDGEPPCSPS